jgi:hypothetical protein
MYSHLGGGSAGKKTGKEKGKMLFLKRAMGI